MKAKPAKAAKKPAQQASSPEPPSLPSLWLIASDLETSAFALDSVKYLVEPIYEDFHMSEKSLVFVDLIESQVAKAHEEIQELIQRLYDHARAEGDKRLDAALAARKLEIEGAKRKS